GPEQPGEHVAVHERAEVAEHRLHLDLRVPGEDRPEELLVVLAGLGHLHGSGGGAVLMTLNSAPCGSLRIAMRPTGVSTGGTTTDPPSSVALAAVASASSVPKYTCQWLGTPGICGGIEPPTIASPALNTVYGSPSPMSMSSVVRP